MKNPLHYIQEYPHRTKQTLGITFTQFHNLLAQAEIHHNELQPERERNKVRVNEKGGGRKRKLKITVTVVAGTLQKAGLIRYSHGQMTILDRLGLEETTCECYVLVKQEFDRLLGGRHYP